MKPAKRVEAALKGEVVDKVPFTVYQSMIPQSTTERLLRNKGVCILNGFFSCYKSKFHNCIFLTKQYEENGRNFSRHTIRTPIGEISSLFESTQLTIWSSTSWCREYPFKRPEDYRVLKFWIEDEEYSSDYETFLRMKKLEGDDVFIRGSIDYSPFQYIIERIMGIERFSIEWAERSDEVLKLYGALTQQRRKLYPILAKSPILAFNYGGNIVSEVIGKERFKKYVLPHYDELAEILHKEGKLMGVHFDSNNKLLKEEIAISKMDYVEAFTPSPDCDMSVTEARKAWPHKVLWINFPSSVHLANIETIEKTTKELLYEAAPGDRFLISITEDVPEDRWQESFLAITRTIDQYGQLPIEK